MLRIILRHLNAPGFLLMMLIGVGLQTSLFSSPPLDVIEPDLLLLAVVWCSLRRDFVEGGILVLILGEVAEVNSAAPQGLFLTTFMAIYLLTRVSTRYVALPFLSSHVLLAMSASIAWKFFYQFFLIGLGVGQPQWRHLVMYLFPGAAVQGLAAYWLFPFFSWYDIATYKNEKARRAMEEEVQLAEEGI